MTAALREPRGLVERLKSSAAAFRTHPIHTADGDPVLLTVQADELAEAASLITTQARRIEELTAERMKPFEPDEIEGLANKWPRVIHTMLAAERRAEASEARATRAEGERDEAKAEAALAVDMHRELASWADHRHMLSDDGHLHLQRRARIAEARILSLEAELKRTRETLDRHQDAIGYALAWTDGETHAGILRELNPADVAALQPQEGKDA